MKKNKKKHETNNLHPQDLYEYLTLVINVEITDDELRERTIESLDTLIEKLMDGEGWQG